MAAVDDQFHLSLLADPDFYDSLVRYAPTGEFLAVVRAVLPTDWRVRRSDIWFQCAPPNPTLPDQGWKIHVSATRDDATAVLRTTATVLAARGVMFKFALDPFVHGQLNGKNWPRSGSGKFVTVYPRSDAEFAELLAELHPLLADRSGPYVLSDRRYRDSKVLHYRYGAFTHSHRLLPTGDRVATLAAPDGTMVPDRRQPHFSSPPWVSDPFPPDDVSGPAGQLTLRDDRYLMERVLYFSNTGGVYLATDRDTGAKVVVKEARPHSGGDSRGLDSFTLLTKEHEILERLAPSGVAPRPVELFTEWEHLFLVEEYVEGLSLFDYAAAHNKLISPHLDDALAADFRATLCRLWVNVAEAVAAVHDLDVVLGDVAPRNMLVDPDTLTVRLIDFEAASRTGIDAPALMATPGYASDEHVRHGATDRTDDYYALGSVMLASLLPVNAMFGLDPTVRDRMLRAYSADLRLPDAWTDMIRALVSADPAERPHPRRVAEVLRAQAGGLSTATRPDEVTRLADLPRRVARHTQAAADYARTDRLFPGDPRVLGTNPLGLAHGAAGVAWALHQLTGEVPRHAVAWILARDLSPDYYPAGLYAGASGIAWALAELGVTEPALRVMSFATAHPARFESPDVYAGAAGYGLACLALWDRAGEQLHLDAAVAAAEHLLLTRREENGTACWPDEHGRVPVGYLHGASGIALFLLYVHGVTGDQRYLDVGRAALAFDLGQGELRDGVLSFPQATGQGGALFPYFGTGSAGVGTTLVRYWAATGDDSYRALLDPLALDCTRRYASFPGLFNGLAGLGNLLLDCHQFTGDPAFLDASRLVADGVRLFAMERPAGVAFPGDFLYRLSTDLASGSTGIALYLKRLEENGPNFLLPLDHLLPARVTGALELAGAVRR